MAQGQVVSVGNKVRSGAGMATALQPWSCCGWEKRVMEMSGSVRSVLFVGKGESVAAELVAGGAGR
jgi:hypothetical protein